MNTKEAFVLNDPIHKRVVLNEIESSVVAHRIFQRLRRIKALGFLDRVFGSARHSRFEHSIGACHVVSLMVEHLKANHQTIADLSRWTAKSEFKPWADLMDFLTDTRVKQVRLAALLHDVGHGPFSHASETIMPLRSTLAKENQLPQYLQEALNAKDNTSKDKKADHEDYSLILAWRILKDISPDHGEMNDDFIKDVLAIKFSTVAPSNPKNKMPFDLFRNFVDGEFDGDRMDYLIRDSFFCGVPYGNFDLQRLLEGLYVLQSKSNELQLGIKSSSLTAFEDFLFARFQMHVQVYSHRVDAAFNCALETITAAANKPLPSKIEDYVAIDDENFIEAMGFDNNLSLKQLILDRRKWKLLFETKHSDDPIPNQLQKAVEAEVGAGLCGVTKSKRLFRKPEVLKLPVVMTNRSKNFWTEDLKEIDLVLSRYSHEFFVRRVFVDPAKLAIAESHLSKFEAGSETIKTQQELIAVKNSPVQAEKKASGEKQ